MLQHFLPAARPGSIARLGVGLLVGLLLLSWTGCGSSPPPPEDEAPALTMPREPLRVLVLDDPPLAAAVRGLADDWQALTGGQLEVATVGDASAAAHVSEASGGTWDVAIFPSYRLGELAPQLAPLSDEFLRRPDLGWNQVFPLLRRQEAQWGTETLAAPLGSPVLALYYRADLFERLGKRPPGNWTEYQELVAFFNDRAGWAEQVGDLPVTEPWQAAVEPSVGDAAAFTWLARAASYARHPDYFSTLFNIESMEPQIATRPFVRALEEMMAARGSPASADNPPAEEMRLGAAEALRRIRDGRCAMALAWPVETAAADDGESTGERPSPDEPDDRPAALAVEVRVAPLPGAAEVWHPEKKTYLPAAQRVVVLATQGRLLGLRRREASLADPADVVRYEAAQLLLANLAGGAWSSRISAASDATTVFRGGQAGSPEPWSRGASLAESRRYAETAQESLQDGPVIFALRIPGRARYLEALNESLDDALAGRQSPADALQQAADRWQEITDQLGRNVQKKAYRQSVMRLH